MRKTQGVQSSYALPVLVFVCLLCVNGSKAQSNGGTAVRSAQISGVQMRYLIAGKGSAVVLLHGYAETSRMWRPIIPQLAEKFTVIAPDLPGIGDSDIPAGGLDMKSSAKAIHDLLKSLGIQKARVVGHDIGLMVAYAHAAMYPSETEKLVVMDAFLPGVAGWEEIYNSPGMWHLRFTGPTPEALVSGRERTYFEHYWNDFAANKNHSLSEADRAFYASAYSRPGRMHAGWAYFIAFLQTAKDFEHLAKTKLTMPVLSIGGDKSLGEALGNQMKSVATNVTEVVLKNTGHWIMEENPKETTGALCNFSNPSPGRIRDKSSPWKRCIGSARFPACECFHLRPRRDKLRRAEMRLDRV